MRPVRGGKGIVAEYIAQRCEELCHAGVICFLARRKAGVLHKHHRSGGQSGQRVRVRTFHKGDRLTQSGLQRGQRDTQ